MNELFQCQICGFVFKTFAMLLLHYDLQHRGKKK